MRRYHQEQHIIDRHFKERQRMAGTRGKWQEQRGRYRKRDAYDCGHARCGICHREKLLGHEQTRQEILSELKLLEE